MIKRYNTSLKKINKFYNVPYNNNNNYGDANNIIDTSEINDFTFPRGIWFTHDENMSDKYVYEINIDNEIFTKITQLDSHKICVLENSDDIQIFCNKYCVSQKNDERVHNREYYGPATWKQFDREHSMEYFEPINWRQIKKDFAGIELFELTTQELDALKLCCYRVYLMLSSIKKQCGCIWNVKSINKIKRIK